MISFENTEIAFSDRSNKELNRSYWLFRLVGNPTLVRLGKIGLSMGLSLRLPIKGVIRATVFEHFCGGESIGNCEETIERLHQKGISTLLDYSAEGKESEEDFDNSCEEVLRTVNLAEKDARIPFCVFKPSALIRSGLLAKLNAGGHLNETETQEWELGKARVRSICQAGFEKSVGVFIDAEESWIQSTIDGIAEEMMNEFNRDGVIVYNTIQLYRKDRLAFLKSSFESAQKSGYKLGLKLVRGAYMEKERERAKDQGYPSPIHDSKSNTDRDYDLALKFCLDNYPNIQLIAGTHNEKSSKYLAELMDKNGIELNDSNIYFSQLYGMSDNIGFNLAANNYNVVKYVPYGPVLEVMPYLIRRAEENTSIAGQTGRELSLIMQEKARRAR
ncbi:proline dehydrogenase family protein [Flavobacteriales bacterium]|nr:proline dehydrogenase family protein [Flavobacteriales bacterium]